MRNVKYLLIAALVIGVVGLSVHGAADAPKNTIKDVMKKAHKGDEPLCKKAVTGSASDTEKKELLALYTDLAANKPPQGDADAWKTKTAAIVIAAKGVVDGKAGAGKDLGKAINCKSCHDAFRAK